MRQVGRDTVVEEALRDHLSGWYSRAVAVAGIDPIDRPTIDWTDEPLEGAPFAFTAEVEVKPPPEVKSYKGLEGVKAETEVPQEAVDGEIERLRATVAELTAVERGAQDGDFLVIDFEGTMDGTPVSGCSPPAFLSVQPNASAFTLQAADGTPVTNADLSGKTIRFTFTYFAVTP